MSTEETLVRFLNLLTTIRRISSFRDMTSDEEQLLFELIVRWSKVREVSVSEVMNDDSHDASPTTIYRRLMAMKAKGLIDIKVSETDSRLNVVCPSKTSKEFIKKMTAGLDVLIRKEKRT